MNNVLYQYRVFCNTCQTYKNIPGYFPSTDNITCPDNSTHTLDTSSFCQTNELIFSDKYDFDGRLRSVDTSKSEAELWSYWTSAGDGTAENNYLLGAGNVMQTSITGSTDSSTLEIRFREWVETPGGELYFQNFKMGDHVELWVAASGTVLTGWSSGKKYNLQALGGGVYCIVEDSESGTYSISGLPTPVEAYDRETWKYCGFWDWDGHGNTLDHYIFKPEMDGKYNFYPNETPIDLGWSIKNARPLGSGSTSVFIDKDSASIYPGWILKIKLNNGNLTRTDDLTISVILEVHRKYNGLYLPAGYNG